MSIPIFPIRPVSGNLLRVHRRFPDDAELIGSNGAEWVDFMAEYGRQSSTTRTAIVAPVDGTIRFVQKEYRGEMMHLLEFRPKAPLSFQSIPGWNAPLPKSFLFNVFSLIDDAFRLEIFRVALVEYKRRRGNRFYNGDMEGDVLRNHDSITLTDSNINDIAVRALGANYEIAVERDQSILVADLNIQLGMVHYSRDNSYISGNAIGLGNAIYWFDPHEYFLRLKAAFPIDFTLDFRPVYPLSTNEYRIRYEQRGDIAETLIEKVSGGIQKTSVYYPPAQPIQDGTDSYNPRTLAIPKEIFMLTPSTSAMIQLSEIEINSRYALFSDREQTTRVWRSSAITGSNYTLNFSSIHYSWAETRSAPYNVALTYSYGRGFSFFVVKDLVGMVETLTDALVEKNAVLANLISNPVNAQKVKIIETMHRIKSSAAADMQIDFDDLTNRTEFTGFSSLYMSMQNDIRLATDALISTMNLDFFNQLKAEHTDANLTILNEALEQLDLQPRAREFLEALSSGFMVDGNVDNTIGRYLNFDWFKSLWNVQRRLRGPVVKAIFNMVRGNMYRHIRHASRLGRGLYLGYLEQMEFDFRSRFGELNYFTSVSADYEIIASRSLYDPITGRYIIDHTAMRRPRFVSVPVTTALDSNNNSGQSNLGNSELLDLLGDAYNTFNLLGSFWHICKDILKLNRQQTNSNYDYYNLVKDVVGMMGDLYHLHPARHYSGSTGQGFFRSGQGFSSFFRGFSMVFGAVGMLTTLIDANELHSSGNYAAANLHVAAAAGGALTIGAEGLVLLGAGSATSGPFAILIVSGAFINILFTLMANGFRDSAIEVDMRHTFFGRDYPLLKSNFNAFNQPVERDFIEHYFNNKYSSWVDNLPRQLAHLNNYLFPLSASLTNVQRANPRGGGQVRVITFAMPIARAKAWSRVYYELYAPGTPNMGVRGTFVIEPDAIRDGNPHSASEIIGGSSNFYYTVSEGINGTLNITVVLIRNLSDPLSNISQGVVGVTYEPSIEYTFRLNGEEGFTEADREYLRNYPTTVNMVEYLRANPFDFLSHEPFYNMAIDKSQEFIHTS